MILLLLKMNIQTRYTRIIIIISLMSSYMYIILYDDGRLLRQMLLARARKHGGSVHRVYIHICSLYSYIILPILTDATNISILYYNNDNTGNNNSSIPTNIYAPARSDHLYVLYCNELYGILWYIDG